MSEQQQVASVFACGPSTSRCKCACGTAGGECEHTWDGPCEEFEYLGGFVSTATCSRCGMSAFSHSMWVGP